MSWIDSHWGYIDAGLKLAGLTAVGAIAGAIVALWRTDVLWDDVEAGDG